jgi:hypothetical protein
MWSDRTITPYACSPFQQFDIRLLQETFEKQFELDIYGHVPLFPSPWLLQCRIIIRNPSSSAAADLKDIQHFRIF